MTKRKLPIPLRLANKYITKILKDDIFGLAAEMAFYLLTAFFPFIILLFIIATNVSDSMQKLLFNFISALPADAENTVMNILLNFTQSIPIVITASFLALWCTSNVINTLKKSLNRFYGAKEERGFIKTRLLCLLFALLIIVLIVLSFTLIIFGEGTGFLLRYLNYFKYRFKFLNTEYIWDRSRYLSVILIFLTGMTVIFKFLPSKKLKLSSVICGSLLTALTWCIASWGFSFYINNFSRYHVIYGSLAGIVILTTWVYMSGFVILLGGELNAFLYRTGKAKRLATLRKKQHGKADTLRKKTIEVDEN